MLFSFVPWQCASIQAPYTELPGVDIHFLDTKRLKVASNLHMASEREIAVLVRDKLQ